MEPTSRSGGVRLDALQPAANNADLWTVYLRGQVRNWLDPFHLADPQAIDVVARPLADMAAAAISNWTAIVAGPAVGAMYEANKPQVNQFVAERAIDPDSIEIPQDLAARRSSPAPVTQLEEWAITSIGSPVTSTREPALV